MMYIFAEVKATVSPTIYTGSKEAEFLQEKGGLYCIRYCYSCIITFDILSLPLMACQADSSYVDL